MSKFAERIKAFELRKKQIIDRQTAIDDLAASEGRSYDDEEKREFDSLDVELQEIDEHIARVKKLEARDAATAVPPGKPGAGAPTQRGPTIIVRGRNDRDPVFKGQEFVRRVIARALSFMDPEHAPAWAFAQRLWGKEMPTLVEVMKAGVAGGGTDSGEWGAELVQADTRYTGDFIEYLYSRTIYDRIGFREVPANVVIKGQDGTATAAWVGQSKSIAATTGDFSTVTLSPLKVAAIATMSKELIRYSSPSAELLVRDNLVNASSQRIDTTVFSSTAASSGVSPAGLLNGLSALGSNGYTSANLKQDVNELYAPFITAKNEDGRLVFVTTPSLAKSISLIENSFGQIEYPQITASGGSLLGDEVFTGHNVPANAFILLKPSDIYRIGDLGVEVSVSDQATIEQDTAPAGAADTPTAASATLMSMFGTDSVAFKVVRPINFAKRRTTAVQWMSDAGYGNPNWVTS